MKTKAVIKFTVKYTKQTNVDLLLLIISLAHNWFMMLKVEKLLSFLFLQESRYQPVIYIT